MRLFLLMLLCLIWDRPWPAHVGSRSIACLRHATPPQIGPEEARLLHHRGVTIVVPKPCLGTHASRPQQVSIIYEIWGAKQWEASCHLNMHDRSQHVIPPSLAVPSPRWRAQRGALRLTTLKASKTDRCGTLHYNYSSHCIEWDDCDLARSFGVDFLYLQECTTSTKSCTPMWRRFWRQSSCMRTGTY